MSESKLVEVLTEEVVRQEATFETMIVRLRASDRSEMRGFAECLSDVHYRQSILVNPNVFNELLGLFSERNWVKPAELWGSFDTRMTVQGVSRWFASNDDSKTKKRVVTPNNATMCEVLDVLVSILNTKLAKLSDDVVSFENKSKSADVKRSEQREAAS